MSRSEEIIMLTLTAAVAYQLQTLGVKQTITAGLLKIVDRHCLSE